MKGEFEFGDLDLKEYKIYHWEIPIDYWKT